MARWAHNRSSWGLTRIKASKVSLIGLLWPILVRAPSRVAPFRIQAANQLVTANRQAAAEVLVHLCWNSPRTPWLRSWSVTPMEILSCSRWSIRILQILEVERARNKFVALSLSLEIAHKDPTRCKNKKNKSQAKLKALVTSKRGSAHRVRIKRANRIVKPSSSSSSRSLVNRLLTLGKTRRRWKFSSTGRNTRDLGLSSPFESKRWALLIQPTTQT